MAVVPVRVALANDYEVVMRGLAAILHDHADRVEVVESTTATGVAANVDIILVDMFGRPPGDEEKLRRLVRENDAKVVIFSWQSYPAGAARAYGVAGTVHKGISGAELADALVAIHEGSRLPRSRSGTAPDGEAGWSGAEYGLGAREAEILALVVQGFTNQQIATQTYLSINTVKTYIRSCYRKLGFTNRAQAVAWGFQHAFGVEDPRQSPRSP
ncbi:response regulator transcription factor [Nocardioides pantholopis]|uniref:response regulator transcription factor n=1 Tax=Nocardioides pantholopis TaxID=2483798 RepID=UPI000FDC826D|nr:response regulator transcription factor [Nocardioides pantholopis]